MSFISKIFIIVVFIAAAVIPAVQAVLPPEEQSKWHEAYLQEVDILAEVEYFNVAFEPRGQGGRRCVAYYILGLIKQHPDELGLESGDQLLLPYPCDSEGNWDWMGSTLPWVQAQAEGRLAIQLSSSYLTPDGPHGWQIKNDPPVFSPVRPNIAEGSAGKGEDVIFITDIDVSNGIDRDEANVIAREFYHRYVSPCGRLGDPVEKDSRFEYPAFFGKKEKLYQHPVIIERATGKVSMVEFSTKLDFKDIESKPAFEEIMNECETSGEEDDLSRERWLQREKDELIYCPVTDHYMLPLEREDYPPEVRMLAPYQRYASCKYGNPATFFAVLTTDPAAAAEGCAHPLLAAARERRVSDVIMGPAAAVDDSRYDFKIASPTYAAYIIATIYDVEKFDYWVDRAYEFLRYVEASSVACNHLPGEPSK